MRALSLLILLLLAFPSGAKDSKDMPIGGNVWKTEFTVDSGSVLMIAVTLHNEDKIDRFIPIWSGAVVVWGGEHQKHAGMLLTVIDEKQRHEEITKKVFEVLKSNTQVQSILSKTNKASLVFGDHNGKTLSEHLLNKP